MFHFFLYFVSAYFIASGGCLLVDIFRPDFRLQKDTLDKIVSNYQYVTPKVIRNILVNSLPLYLFLYWIVGYLHQHLLQEIHYL